jgi:hypothetical protein
MVDEIAVFCGKINRNPRIHERQDEYFAAKFAPADAGSVRMLRLGRPA